MEKDFYTDDFEQLLKDTTEDFRMYPSRKVWHSIYNDLHPAKKWPSFAVCLLLITAILYVGINNNNTINADAENLMLSTLAHTETEAGDAKPFSGPVNKTKNADNSPITAAAIPAQNMDNPVSANTNPRSLNVEISYPVPAETEPLRQAAPDETNAVSLATKQELRTETFVNTIAPQPEVAEVPITDRSRIAEPVAERSAGTVDLATAAVNDPATVHKDVAAETAGKANMNTSLAETSSSPQLKNAKTEDKVWMEDFAFHNKKSGNKWKTKFSTLVYITPSIGYRILNKNNNFEPVNALLIRSSATSVDADDAISQQAALNLESGATAILDLTRKLRVKAGVQFNYTNYLSFAERLSHPTQTNVLLNDLETGNTMLFPFSTSYGNQGSDNRARLNNKTAQFSIPIGADYKLAGNDKIKWYVGATIQPTYVAGGTAYLVSSDYKHYVEVPSMLRTWNLNAGFESIVSYKTKGGSVINIGPQFRYQLFSTYSNRYTYTENLYNVGVKFGITRKF